MTRVRYQESLPERVILWLRFWLAGRFVHLARLSITAAERLAPWLFEGF
jgi:hypothetical protein